MSIATPPEPIEGTHYRATVEKTRRRPDQPDHWYWRTWSRGGQGRKKSVWNGWTTVEGAQAKVDELDAAVAPQNLTPKKKKKKRRKKVAVVGMTEYTKILREKMKANYVTFTNFPDRTNTISSVLDIIVCLYSCTSHAAVDVCLEELRDGKRPVIIVKSGWASVMEQLAQIEAGTWVPRSLADLKREIRGIERKDEEEVEPVEELKLSSREKKRQACAEIIRDIVKSGGLFGAVLCLRSPSQARDALCAVPYASFKVKRAPTFQSFQQLSKHTRSAIEEAQKAVALEDSVVTTSLWEHAWDDADTVRTTDRRKFLSPAPLSDEQLEVLAEALTHKKGVFTLTQSPPVEEEEEEPVEEAAEVLVVVPEPEQEPEPVEELLDFVTPEPEPEPKALPLTEDELLCEYLQFVAATLDQNTLPVVPEATLARAGLCIEDGQLMLHIVHLLAGVGPSGTACGQEAFKSNETASSVTCKTCKDTDVYAYAAWRDSKGAA